MKFCSLVTTMLFVLSVQGQARGQDSATLLDMHRTVINAHLNNDVASWMALEMDTTMSANGGSMARVERSERRRDREAYLARTQFDSYRDLKSPAVRISKDGTLGWVVAEVEVKGWTERQDGSIEDISRVWAWIELYEKTDAGWKMTGNVSNSRPLE